MADEDFGVPEDERNLLQLYPKRSSDRNICSPFFPNLIIIHRNNA